MTSNVELLSNIPDELKTRPQWVCSKPDKMPIQVSGKAASCSDPTTWNSFEACRDAAIQHGWRVAFCFTAHDPYTVLDLDHVTDANTGKTEPWALAILDDQPSYTERSMSETGWHKIVRGKLPAPGNKKGRVELYDSRKFMTLTGNTVLGTGTDEIATVDLRDFHKRMMAGELDPDAATPAKEDRKSTGDTSADDFALACRLAREYSGDATKVKEAFLKQATPRPKLRRSDYVDRTVKNAIAHVLTSQPRVETTKAEIERVPMNTARIVQVWPWNCEPDYHPHWAAYEALERRGAPPEELEAARKLAEIEGHRQFEMPAINPS